jgi:hypothetical protein
MWKPRQVEVAAPAGKLGITFADGTVGARIEDVKYNSPLRLPSGRLLVKVGWQLVAVDGEPVKGCEEAAERLRKAADRERTLTLSVPRIAYGQLLGFLSTLVATVAILYALATSDLLPVSLRDWIARGRGAAHQFVLALRHM